MVEAWPLDLPLDPLIAGYDEVIPSNIKEKQTSSGVPLRFRKYTRPPRFPLSITLPFTRAQVATFLTFYEVTLVDGINPFTFTHPRTGTAITCYFRAEQDLHFKPQPGAKEWHLPVQLEIEP
ncbi:hypothetical protein [Magnetovibrio sp.]|uniref:hypothetical protein n=1 Tax=Magnetovibrio sp. TaxID=2024836 RepID=UPI002F91C6F8